MNYFYPYTLPAPCTYEAMLPTSTTQHTQPYSNSYHLPPIHPQTLQAFSPHPQPFSLATRDPRRGPQGTGQQYHHYYGRWPWHTWANNLWNYQRLYANPPPVAPAAPRPPRFQTQSGTWPEGFTLRGELRWGRLEKVYGAQRELPEFVREDLRRVYGTYPQTDLRVTYQGGEYVVRGDPSVGEQEYRLERRVVRQAGSEGEDGVGEVAEKRRGKGKKGR